MPKLANQASFFNETYCINEKKAVRMIENFPIRPKDYQQRIDKLITLISTDIEQTKRAVNILAELVQEVAELTDKYRMTS